MKNQEVYLPSGLHKIVDEDSTEWVEKREREISDATGLPVGHHLIKAIMDPFDYALRMRSGEVVQFSQAEYVGNGWVRLTLHEFEIHSDVRGEPLAFPAKRGVDIRISDIVWVMDAPRGS